MRHLAFLRGIHVGGKNLITMAALQQAFEDAGFENVATYVASGNVIVESKDAPAVLEGRIENAVSKALGHEARVIGARVENATRQGLPASAAPTNRLISSKYARNRSAPTSVMR